MERQNQAVEQRIVADSTIMRRLLETARSVARKDIPVLLIGESGTGKEVIAQAIHQASHRSERPFVRCNCAALPASLAEAELFGHARGAFTGAHQQRAGIFSEADGGTLLLDEIGELPLEVQAKLLRTLQNGEMQPLGGRTKAGITPRVNVRVLAATNRDLEACVRAGTFRADLLYRLSVVVLRLPPLRERTVDIPVLARAFTLQYGRRFGIGEVQPTQRLIDHLCQQAWPGNVRELENAIARMVALSVHVVIDLADWERAKEVSLSPLSPPSPPSPLSPLSPLSPSVSVHSAPIQASSLRERIERIERAILVEVLNQYRGNQSRTALSLNISRVTLAAKIRKYRIFIEAGRGGAASGSPPAAPEPHQEA